MKNRIISAFTAFMLVASFLPAYGNFEENIDEHSETAVNIEDISEDNENTVKYYSAADEEYISEYEQQTMTQYRSNIEDPKMMTDEVFFGEYDSASESWITESILDYDRIDAFAPIESDVKAGNYIDAKKKLLEYYRDKFANHQYSKTTSLDNDTKLTARLTFENIYAHDYNPITIEKIETGKKLYEIDVTEGITNGVRTFGLMSIKKDGYVAVFNSKEAAEHKPVLKVVVNDRTREYKPIEDAYTSAGNNSADVYGDSDVLKVSESYSSTQVYEGVNEYTFRTYFKFDLSDLGGGDKIGSAHLCLYGGCEKSDDPKQSGIEKDFTDILVLKMSSNNWTEESASFETMQSFPTPTDHRNWEDKISTTEIRLLLNYPVRAYDCTGNEVYAFHAIRAWMERIDHEIPSSSDFHDLSSGMYLYQTNEYLVKLLYSKHMTPEIFTMILKYNYLVMENAINDWGANHEKNNWGTANCVGVFVTSIAFTEYRICDDPLEDAEQYNGKKGGWIEVGKHRAWYMNYKDMFRDGSSVEVSVDYSKFLANMAQMIVKHANALNIDLKDYLDEETIHQMKGYALNLMKYTNPIFGGWQHGHDTYYSSKANGYSGVLSFNQDDENLRWYVSNRAQGKEPEKKSYIFDHSKKVVLRSDWTENAVSLQTNANGGNLRSHGQNDDLAVNVFAYGRPLLMESTHLNYQYHESATGWLLSSKAVNAVEINNVTQKGAYSTDVVDKWGERILASAGGVPGEIDRSVSELNDMYDFVRSESYGYKNHKYLDDDFIMLRDILFVSPKYFIVTDYLEPVNDKETENIYKQYWHSFPKANIQMLDKSFRTNFQGEANIYVAPVEQSIPITENLLEGYWADGWVANTAKYVRYDKKASGITTFNTVLYPMKADENISVETEKIPLDVEEKTANAFSFTATDMMTGKNETTTYYTLFDINEKVQRVFGDYSADTTLALIERNDANYKKAIVKNGTNLTDVKNDIVLFKSNREVSDLGITYNGDELLLDTSKGVSYKDTLSSDKETNLAAGKSGKSSECQNGESEILNAFDADTSTMWKSIYDEVTPVPREYAYLTVDMGGKTEFSKVRLVTDSETQYYLYYSDNNLDWEYITQTTAEVSQDGKYVLEAQFPVEKARYIKALAVEAGSPGIYEFEVFKSNDAAVVLDDLTIYSKNKPAKVLLNGEEITFNYAKGYVYFGDTPILSIEEETPDTPGTESTPPSSDHGTQGSTDSDSGNPGGSGGGDGGGGSSSADDKKDEIKDNTEDGTLWTNPFKDVKETDWYYSNVKYVCENNLFNGVSESSFAPNATMTRAALVTVLHRLSQESAKGENPFVDVLSDEWYTDAIIWAAENGIVNGTSDTDFSPQLPITREALATIMHRYHQYINGKQSDMADISFYDDYDKISPWAESSLAWAVEYGLIKGNGDNTLSPHTNATRAQTAAILERYLTGNK